MRAELLFWKKVPAVYWKSISPTRSRTVPFWSVTQTWPSCSATVLADAAGPSSGGGSGSESRRRSVAPRLYLVMFLGRSQSTTWGFEEDKPST